VRLLISLAFLLVLPASGDTLNKTPGTTLAAPPPVAPGGLAHAGEASLDAGVAAWRSGDNDRAVYLLERWLASKNGPWGRERAAGQFLLGWIHMKEGRYNKASENFTGVRHSGGPLTHFGAYYEALNDHLRGRHSVAGGECSAYREQWPDGYFADDCLLLMGDAYVAAGYNGPAVAAYKKWLKKHPKSPMEEALQVQMARAAANTDVKRGAEMLRWLALSHRYGANGKAAQASLMALLEEHPDLQLSEMDALSAERLRAVSLKNCGHDDEAWGLYCHMEERHSDNDMTASWINSQATSFRWGTRQFVLLADEMIADLEEHPDGDKAWTAFRSLWRAGEWERAAVFAEECFSETYKGHYRWSWNEDQIAHAWQQAGDFEKARVHWDAVAKRGGYVGLAARWFGGFASYRAGDLEAAESRLSELIETDGPYTSAALYYRAKTRIAAGDQPGAREDFQRVLDEDPWSWYGQLVQSRLRPTPSTPDIERHRQGRWPFEGAPDAPAPPSVAETGVPIAGRLVSGASELEAPSARKLDWSAMRWDAEAVTVDPSSAPAPPTLRPPELGPTPLDRYMAASDLDNTMFDPEGAAAVFYRVAQNNKSRWKDLPAAWDLARVGVHELSAPLVGDAYESWKRNRTGGISLAQWRSIFLYAGDYHDSTRSTAGYQAGAESSKQVTDALRLHYPAAYREQVTHWAREYDLDPLMILGVMRQESLYRTWAVSHAGATGLMQVMPLTGAKIADRIDEPMYSPVTLKDPLVSIQYGSWYLSQLMERFGGVWPLAVASYNTGPTNLSTFFGAHPETIAVDDLVEQIPYKETRDYVKRITEHYAHYLALYAPEGAYLQIPLQPAGDRREVIDF